jgi:hypothetical protein
VNILIGGKMRFLFIPLFALALCGCETPFKKAVWTPAEVREWHERWSSPATVQRGIGYQGSDDVFHYFIARPIDSWVSIKIRREELHLEDERPRQQTSAASMGIHYMVDPGESFRKREPIQQPQQQRP